MRGNAILKPTIAANSIRVGENEIAVTECGSRMSSKASKLSKRQIQLLIRSQTIPIVGYTIDLA